MRTTLKWTLVALSGIALVGVAAAATPQGQQTTDSVASHWRAHLAAMHRHPLAAIDKVCDDNITWGDCKVLLHEKIDKARAQAQEKVDERYQQCLKDHSQDYCDGRLDQFKAEHPRLYGNETADESSDA